MTASIETGSVFDNKYQIEAILGSGGAGTVYRAREIELNREVAIKVLHIWTGAIEEEESLRRFKREAKVLCQILHPNILRVYRFGIDDNGVPFLVMEYVQGESLKNLIVRSGPLNYQLCIKIAIKLAEALSYAHENGIIHRDLKPENILVNMDQPELVLKLIDFGLCKPDERINSTQQRTLTGTGHLIGTALYMAPEQVMGQQVDERSDIYSFACVLFEMLTGKPAFGELSTGEVLLKRVNEPLPEILRMNPESRLPPQLDALIQSCSEKNPAKRAQNFRDVIEALKLVKALPSDGRFTPSQESSFGLPKKNLITIAACALVGIGAIAAFLIFGAPSLVQSVTLPEETISSSLSKVNSLLKDKQVLEARTLASESTNNDTFKIWPEVQKSDLYFKYFQAFRDANDKKTALNYLAAYLKAGLNVFQEKETPVNWDERIKECSKFIFSEKLSKTNWRTLAEALEGDLATRNYPGAAYASLLLAEIYEESMYQSRTVDAKVAMEYYKHMIDLAEKSIPLNDDAMFDSFIERGTTMAKKWNNLGYLGLAYATSAAKLAHCGKAKEATKWIQKSKKALAEFQSLYGGNVKAMTLAHSLRLEAEVEEALAKELEKEGNSKEAAIHRQRSLSVASKTNAVHETLRQSKEKNKTTLKEVFSP